MVEVVRACVQAFRELRVYTIGMLVRSNLQISCNCHWQHLKVADAKETRFWQQPIIRYAFPSSFTYTDTQ